MPSLPVGLAAADTTATHPASAAPVRSKEPSLSIPAAAGTLWKLGPHRRLSVCGSPYLHVRAVQFPQYGMPMFCAGEDCWDHDCIVKIVLLNIPASMSYSCQQHLCCNSHIFMVKLSYPGKAARNTPAGRAGRGCRGGGGGWRMDRAAAGWPRAPWPGYALAPSTAALPPPPAQHYAACPLKTTSVVAPQAGHATREGSSVGTWTGQWTVPLDR